MAYGLKTWNASGQLVIDVTDRLARFHGQYDIAAMNSSSADQWISVPGFALDGTWFWQTLGYTAGSYRQDTPNDVGIQVIPSSGGFTIHWNSNRNGTYGPWRLYVFRG